MVCIIGKDYSSEDDKPYSKITLENCTLSTSFGISNISLSSSMAGIDVDTSHYGVKDISEDRKSFVFYYNGTATGNGSEFSNEFTLTIDKAGFEEAENIDENGVSTKFDYWRSMPYTLGFTDSNKNYETLTKNNNKYTATVTLHVDDNGYDIVGERDFSNENHTPYEGWSVKVTQHPFNEEGASDNRYDIKIEIPADKYTGEYGDEAFIKLSCLPPGEMYNSVCIGPIYIKVKFPQS